MIRNNINLEKALSRLNNNQSPLPVNVERKLKGNKNETNILTMDDKFKEVK